MSTPPPNDHEINRRIRAVLSRHWVDLASTNFASRKGIVRVSGDLKRIGPQAGRALESTSLTNLDSEIRRLKGVQRVHFDLANWRRTEDGEWVRIDKQERETDEAAPSKEGAEPPPALPSQPDGAQ